MIKLMFLIGMKVCGGYDERGNHIGIFVKQILENGLAKKSGISIHIFALYGIYIFT